MVFVQLPEIDEHGNIVLTDWKDDWQFIKDHSLLDFVSTSGQDRNKIADDPNAKYDKALKETEDNDLWGLSAIKGPEEHIYVPDSDMVTNPYYLDEEGIKQENPYYKQRNTREVQLFFENNEMKREANTEKKDIATNKQEQRDWMFWEMRRTRLQEMANRLMDKAQSNEPFQYKLMGEQST